MELRPSLFWDADPRAIDLKAHARYVIERIMDFGRDDEVRWLWSFYDKALLEDVVSTSRAIRPETRALWKLLLQTA